MGGGYPSSVSVIGGNLNALMGSFLSFDNALIARIEQHPRLDVNWLPVKEAARALVCGEDESSIDDDPMIANAAAIVATAELFALTRPESIIVTVEYDQLREEQHPLWPSVEESLNGLQITHCANDENIWLRVIPRTEAHEWVLISRNSCSDWNWSNDQEMKREAEAIIDAVAQFVKLQSDVILLHQCPN